jgi:1,2-diacylglycerol 3-alpha-glucosyltransferase
MHVVILFHNIGGYHAARLRAAHEVCQQQGWQFTAIQETDSADEHPWGDLEKEITFPLKTLLPTEDTFDASDRHPQSTVAASRLPGLLKKLSPDVLMIPGWGYPNSRAALKWAKKQRIPTVLMSESKWDDEPRIWWKEKLKAWLYVGQFQAALVGGQLHYDYLLELGFPKSGILFGYDVVDNAHFFENVERVRDNPALIRQQQPDIPIRPYFITVTRFIARKNVLGLIDAYAQYRTLALEHRPQPQVIWDLVICGSGAEENHVRRRIAHHGLDASIHLPGFKRYQEIPHWLALAKAFIHPALNEQWGLVVNEAMASGLPVLVSNRCGCFPELIREGVNGFGFDPQNVGELAQLMAKVSDDAANLSHMAQAAREHIELFSPAIFAQGFQQSIEYALSH